MHINLTSNDRRRLLRAVSYRPSDLLQERQVWTYAPAIKVGGSTRILAEDEQYWLAKQRQAGLQQEAAR